MSKSKEWKLKHRETGHVISYKARTKKKALKKLRRDVIEVMYGPCAMFYDPVAVENVMSQVDVVEDYV